MVGLERDTNATIKAVLSELEALAKLPPDKALTKFNMESRRNVVRRIWALHRRLTGALDADFDGTI